MKKQQSRTSLIIALGLIIVLLGLAFLLEKRLPQKDETEKEPETPGIITIDRDHIKIPAATLVKGCLFDLGLNKDQVQVNGNSFDVTCDSEFSSLRLTLAFRPIRHVGTVDVVDNRLVRLTINDDVWEVHFNYATAPTPTTPPVTVTEPSETAPCRVAIIIDDIGLNMAAVKRLAAINANLTFSVMPQLAGSRPAAQFLSARGREIMLHQPMESMGGLPLGPGAIMDNMQPAEARSILEDNLDSLPMVKGVNNHEGSRVTQNAVLMNAVMGVVKKRGLFFVDSMTTPKSLGKDAARDAGVPVAIRNVFLDNEQNPAYIKAQLAKLEKMARKNGGAIAICHPHAATVSTLETELPAMQSRGVKIVPVSSFVRG